MIRLGLGMCMCVVIFAYMALMGFFQHFYVRVFTFLLFLFHKQMTKWVLIQLSVCFLVTSDKQPTRYHPRKEKIWIQNHIFCQKCCCNFLALEFPILIFLNHSFLQNKHLSHPQKEIFFFFTFLFLSMYLLLIYAYMNLTSITRGHVRGRLKGKVMEMCFSLVLPFNSQSQLSTDHTYVQGFLLPGACRSITANEHFPWYNSHQGSINFLFLCLQQCIKMVLHQSLLLFSSASCWSPPPPHHNETVNFKGLGTVDVGVLSALTRKAENAVNFTQDSFSVI